MEKVFQSVYCLDTNPLTQIKPLDLSKSQFLAFNFEKCDFFDFASYRESSIYFVMTFFKSLHMSF